MSRKYLHNLHYPLPIQIQLKIMAEVVEILHQKVERLSALTSKYLHLKNLQLMLKLGIAEVVEMVEILSTANYPPKFLGDENDTR